MGKKVGKAVVRNRVKMAIIDEFVKQKLYDGSYKRCPFCGQLSELISGCNYVTCVCKQGKGNISAWCWKCSLPKYEVWKKLLACNDKSHNSH